MEITLEKIELVKDRTGVSYAEAKEALESADGSVVDAIISIEETIDQRDNKSFSKQSSQVIENLKELIKKGNVSKILVKRDDEIVLNLPVNAGILGTIIAPWGAVLGVVAAFGFKCSIEVVKDDGTIIDVSDSVTDTVETVIEKGSVVADGIKEKSADIYKDAREKGTDFYQNAKTKATDAINSVKKDKDGDIDFSDCFTDDDGEGNVVEDIKDKAADVASDIKDKAEDVIDGTKDKVNQVKDKVQETKDKVKDTLDDLKN